jgi:hypothetical protein
VPTVFFPMMWFEERATVTPELAGHLSLLLAVSTAGFYCSLGLLLLGVCTLAVSLARRSDNWILPRLGNR